MAYFECVIGGGGTSLTIQITTSSTVLYGQTITISKGGSTVGTTAFDNTGNAEYTVREAGTYTVSVTMSGVTFSDTVEVTDTFDATIEATPDGSTVTPVNDIQIWLHCGNVWNKNYTTLSEVLADTTTLLALINSNNAVDYMVRSHAWCDDVCADATAMTYIGANNYAADTLLADDNPGLVPVMTSNTEPSGVASANSSHTYYGYYPWKAFNPTENLGWAAHGQILNANDWVAYEFTSAIEATMVRVYSANKGTIQFKIQGSNDGFTNEIDDLCQSQTITSAVDTWGTYLDVSLNTSKPYTKNRLIGTAAYSGTAGAGIKLQFYAKDGSWLEAICNSTYFESVLNVKVPIMTSDTTPSGEVFATTYHSNTEAPWKAFDGNDSTDWGATNGLTSNQRIGYHFTSSVTCVKMHVLPYFYNHRYMKNYEIQGSNDGTNFETIMTGFSSDVSDAEDVIFKNTVGYTYIALYVRDTYANQIAIKTLQFYGRAAS